MGIFHVDCIIENLRKPGKNIAVKKIMVDTGAEYTWIPQEILEQIELRVMKKDVPFLLANGQVITRDVGYAIIRSDEFETVDEMVFAKPGDLRLLGFRTLDGFAATVDPRRKKLVAAGPIPAAYAASSSSKSVSES